MYIIFYFAQIKVDCCFIHMSYKLFVQIFWRIGYLFVSLSYLFGRRNGFIFRLIRICSVVIMKYLVVHTLIHLPSNNLFVRTAYLSQHILVRLSKSLLVRTNNLSVRTYNLCVRTNDTFLLSLPRRHSLATGSLNFEFYRTDMHTGYYGHKAVLGGQYNYCHLISTVSGRAI